MTRAPKCPTCGEPATLRESDHGPFFECCGMWAWPGFSLVDHETREAREAAHAAFDPLWREGLPTRREAYLRLAEILRVEERWAHMRFMPADMARRVPAACRRIRAQVEAERARAQREGGTARSRKQNKVFRALRRRLAEISAMEAAD